MRLHNRTEADIYVCVGARACKIKFPYSPYMDIDIKFENFVDADIWYLECYTHNSFIHNTFIDNHKSIYIDSLINLKFTDNKFILVLFVLYICYLHVHL